METRKKKTNVVTVMLVLVGLAVFGFSAFAGSLEPSAPPGPTMKTLDEVEPRIPISSVPFTVSQSGSYYLAGDLEAAYCGDHGIRIDANNVTIDLSGFSLYEPTFSCTYDGITVLNFHENITIRNGTIRGFGQDGVDLSNAKNCRLIDLRVFNNGQDGLSTGAVSYISACTVQSNGYYGIHAKSGSTVTGNTCHNNTFHGIYTGYGCTVTGNTCHSNGDDGIQAGYGSTVTGNTCHNNTFHGIYTGYGCTVTCNTCYSNGDEGIYANSGCTLIGNTVRYNTDYGIYASGYCLVDQNTTYGNGTNMYTGTGCQAGLNVVP